MCDNMFLMIDGMKEVGEALAKKISKRKNWRKRLHRVASVK